jgi:hypothetical protein
MVEIDGADMAHLLVRLDKKADPSAVAVIAAIITNSIPENACN